MGFIKNCIDTCLDSIFKAKISSMKYDNPDKRYSTETVNHLMKFKEILNGKCQIS